VAGPVLRVLGMGVALMLATAGPVWAHAFPDHSDPRVGSEVKPSPAQVKIWFDGGIEPLFSSLEVFDANHKKVDKGDSRVDPKDNTVLEVSLPSLPPGTYTVSWSVIALDTHHTEGTFKFSIGR
jgi:methionine-rich copper-binding protein CopC